MPGSGIAKDQTRISGSRDCGLGHTAFNGGKDTISAGQGVVEYTFQSWSGQRPGHAAVLCRAVSVTDTRVFAKLRTGLDLKLLLLPVLNRELNSPVLGLTLVSCFSLG